MKPYGIISDSHHHQWSAFSTVNADGVNSRLQVLLDETKRCAAEVRLAGGNTLVHAGDLFHVRGNLAPSVLNPTIDCYRDIIKGGVDVILLAGNHDLEGKDAARVSSAITSLEGVGCKIINKTNYDAASYVDLVMIPWQQNIADLKAAIEFCDPADRIDTDLIIHAPIDGVIKGLPDHGLTDDYLAKLGFHRVFAGHYHHHKNFGNGVYSIGALAHHTWGDIGTKAGFLIVKEGEPVRWFKSHAPEFIEVTAETDLEDVALLVDGNFVRVKTSLTKASEVEEVREFLTECGAKGVVVLAQKDATVTARTGSTISAGASIEVSVGDFIKTRAFANSERLAILCQDILKETESAK